jgi:hypothetical protein
MAVKNCGDVASRTSKRGNLQQKAITENMKLK